ncbi:MAG: 2-amino-4-hydroxy-6-hydroxymethyldihydropteridine diphosphokinase [Saprospiraceae bacterium]
MNKVELIYLLLGSNVGNKIDNLKRAKLLIGERIGKIQRSSGFYETQAWGKTDQEDFVNQALEVRSYHSPEQTLRTVLEIEKEMGRTRSIPNEPRIIDIDILFYGNRVIKSRDLQVPHPRFHLRNFAMVPMMEVNGDFIHPVFQKAIDELYFETTDNLDVILIE